MGEPTVVVLHNEGSDHSSQDTAQITSTIQRALHERSHPTSEEDGPLKQVLGSDSLYKYISWEDPLRTLGTYLGALSILFGAHYLPLTQWTLKAGMTTLGVVSITEFASRSFSSDSLSTRLRPKEYKTFNESTLNATLRDVHDLIQSGAIQAQRVLYGQDLEKTFGAFVAFTALYGLVQVLSPFWLAILGLTSIFIAPLVNSPQGRKVAQDASVRAQELAGTTAEKGKELAKNGQVKASELSSKAQQAAYDAGNSVSDTAQSGKQAAADLSARARGTASDLSGAAAENARNAGTALSNTAENGKQTAADLSSKAKDTAFDLSGAAADNTKNAGANVSNAAQNGKHAAADLSSKASGAASDASGYATDNVKNLPEAGSNAINNAQGILSSAFGDAKRYISDSSSQNYTHEPSHNSSHNVDRTSGGDHPRNQSEYSIDGLASRASHSSHVGVEPPRLSAADDVNRRAI
ncbi:reticulon-like protein 1 Cwl1 [Colletotrichum tofieldiae]|uniref:Reticulon-like protein 1 Cwl1 n=1 Tax=Colletotrichum tofieldiae TaxID=708197 RepID=A0A166V0H9_9PEZI|nr:Reticulon-like protein 1 Cwl1 [Colletotrichum tofieldiae]GKT61699.1 reticulon-like protein 1 Cwl1 [Colletotrichum tofieldiae]GKT70246.1 reticulon-like protein 1 Cwl1 [Colletotrichum tofieldiae]